MKTVLQALRVALRSAVWRRTPIKDFEPGLAHVLVGCLLLLITWLAIQYLRAGAGTGMFRFYGLNALVAWLAISLTVGAAFVQPGRRMAYVAVTLAGSIVLSPVLELIGTLAAPYLAAFSGDSLWRGLTIWLGMLALNVVWSIGATVKALDSLQPDRAPQLRCAALMCVANLAAFALVPHYPVFIGHDFNRTGANMWEYVRAWLPSSRQEASRPAFDVAKVELSQPFLLDAMTSRLVAERPGQTDIYFIGVAGWEPQTVFHKELSAAVDIVDRNLPIRGQASLLVNDDRTLDDLPIANRQNFAAVVRATARQMNKEEDVLFLLMTSHGSPDGLALVLPGSVNADLSPEDVSSVLDAEGIKNRIVVVSACYSGVFIKPLANDNTIVLTAADENSTSFGCSNDRDWTYFGDALFARSLVPGRNLQSAFADAKALIHDWEAKEGITPSNPQAHFGTRLVSRLAPLYAARAAEMQKPGAVVQR